MVGKMSWWSMNGQQLASSAVRLVITKVEAMNACSSRRTAMTDKKEIRKLVMEYLSELRLKGCGQKRLKGY